MGKKAEQHKVRSESGITLEHNTVYDDSLLPSADELIKINQISPDIIPWLQKRSDLEQDTRIKSGYENIRIIRDEMTHMQRYNYISLFMAFILVACFIGASFYLIINGHNVIGTIFASSAFIWVVSTFVKGKKDLKINE